MIKPKSVDEYISSAPEDIQPRLKQLRSAIKSAVPQASERISYSVPFYEYHGRLVYFAYAKNHIGVYAIFDDARKQFDHELGDRVQSKGTIQFPHDEPLPIPLIKKLVKAQAKFNRQRYPNRV